MLLKANFTVTQSQIRNTERLFCSDGRSSSSWSVFNHLHFPSAFLCGVTTAEEFEVLEGRSLTVPCHYDPQYASSVKYWCQGRMRDFCTSLARTDDPRSTNPSEDRVSIFDDPVQLVFTVTMNNLKERDSGWYFCGVEIAGIWSRDAVTTPYIKVIHGEWRRYSELMNQYLSLEKKNKHVHQMVGLQMQAIDMSWSISCRYVSSQQHSDRRRREQCFSWMPLQREIQVFDFPIHVKFSLIVRFMDVLPIYN